MKHVFPFLFLFFIFWVCTCNAQHTANHIKNWHLGTNVGISFNNGSPVNITSSITGTEVTVSQSNGHGDQLFYIGAISSITGGAGFTVWDASHNTMPNGDVNIDYTSSCGLAVAPVPGNCDQYYLFHLTITTTYGLHYSIIDMSLPGNGSIPAPLGDVDVNQKDSLIFGADTLAEKIKIVQKGNTEDYWVIARSINNDLFYSFEVTSAGINPVPIVSTISAISWPTTFGSPIFSWLAVNKQRNIIAEANGYGPDVKLFSIDNNTGILAFGEVIIPTGPIGDDIPYGIEFSPSGEALYVNWYQGATNNYISSFDITAGFGSIGATRQDYLISNGSAEFGALLKAADGKLYGTRLGYPELTVINNPEDPLNPNIVYPGFNPGPGVAEVGLPNVSYYFHPDNFIDTLAGDDRSICDNEQALIGAIGYDSIWASYLWEPATMVIDSANAVTNTIPLTTDQEFVLTVISSCGDTIASDTVIVNVGALPTPSIFTPDAWYCTTDNITPITTNDGDLWYSDPGLTTLVGIDTAYTPPVIAGVSTYYVIDTTGGCYSLADSVTVTFDSCYYPCPSIQNQLTNGDFETFSSCPTNISQMTNATGWLNIQSNSNDYFNQCDFVGKSPQLPGYNGASQNMFINPEGNGYAGFFVGAALPGSSEGFGQAVNLKKCIEYTLQFRMAHNGITDSIEGNICIYGGNAATASACMTGYTSLACIQGDSISENWRVYEITFIPPQNFTYLAIAGECPSATSLNEQYVYIDDMFLCEKPCLTTWIDNITIIPIADDTCGMNTGSMTVDFTTQCYTGFNFEWKQGAVVMSTDSIATGLAAGLYSLGITDSNCSTYMIGPSISAFNPITSIVITPSSASICPGDSISLLASGATNYSWSPSTGLSCTSCPNPVATPTSTTTYQVVGSIGPCSDSTTITITVSSSINTLDTALICAGDSLFLGGAWQTSAGNYKDTLTASGGCDSIVATNLSIVPPSGSSNNTNVCPGDSVFVQGAWQTIAGAYYDTLTSILGCDSVIETVLSVDTVYSISSSVSICQGDSVLLPGGSYTSIAGIFTDSFSTVTSCDSVFITNVTVDTAFDAEITPVNAVCANSGFLILTAADVGGTWSGTGITNADSGYFDPSVAGAGTHEIIYLIGGGCGNSDTVNINVYEVPSLSILGQDESCNGENDGSVDLLVTGGALPYTYLWDNPGSSTTEDLMGLPPGTYTVVLTDANLCSATDNTIVGSSSTSCASPYLYIPNIFSPNGDGENDKLYAQGAGVAEIIFIIYDRWGEKIFETNDLIDGWDGSYQGKPMNEAVFVYYVKASLINNKIIERKGNISIVK